MGQGIEQDVSLSWWQVGIYGQGYLSMLWRTGNTEKTWEEKEGHQPYDIPVWEAYKDDRDLL